TLKRSSIPSRTSCGCRSSRSCASSWRRRMPRKRCQPEAPLCQQCGCEMSAATYAYGRRYDHPDDTLAYILDTLRAMMKELSEIKAQCACAIRACRRNGV